MTMCLPSHFLNKSRHTLTLRTIGTYLLNFQVFPKKFLQMPTSEQVYQFRWERRWRLKKIIFEMWTYRGVSNGAMQFHMQVMHVSRHFWHHKFKFRKNWFIIWSQICEKMASFVYKITLKNTLLFFLVFSFIPLNTHFQSNSMDQESHVPTNRRPEYQNCFFLLKLNIYIFFFP